MSTETNPSPRALLFGGDWACAHGDTSALADIARRLSDRVEDPLRLELLELSSLCRCNHELAAHRWPQVRARVADRFAHPAS